MAQKWVARKGLKPNISISSRIAQRTRNSIKKLASKQKCISVVLSLVSADTSSLPQCHFTGYATNSTSAAHGSKFNFSSAWVHIQLQQRMGPNSTTAAHGSKFKFSSAWVQISNVLKLPLQDCQEQLNKQLYKSPLTQFRFSFFYLNIP